MAEHFHVIKITGNLIFDSKYPNFRLALRDYLSRPDNEGTQLQIIDMNNRDNHPEDVVVTMSLAKMKQNPQDMKAPVENTIKSIQPRKPKAVSGSDTCFY